MSGAHTIHSNTACGSASLRFRDAIRSVSYRLACCSNPVACFVASSVLCALQITCFQCFSMPGCYCVLRAAAFGTSPGAVRAAASTGTGAGTGGAISSQSVTLFDVRVMSGFPALVTVIFSSVPLVWSAIGAGRAGRTKVESSCVITESTIMRWFDSILLAPVSSIIFPIRMAGGFGCVEDVSDSNTAGCRAGGIMRSPLAIFSAQTLAPEAPNTTQNAAAAVNRSLVAIFPLLTTQPAICMAVSPDSFSFSETHAIARIPLLLLSAVSARCTFESGKGQKRFTVETSPR